MVYTVPPLEYLRIRHQRDRLVDALRRVTSVWHRKGCKTTLWPPYECPECAKARWREGYDTLREIEVELQKESKQ